MTWRMRFIEIDGKRHDVPCCHSCPCYDNGDDGWGCKCKHPDGDGVSAEHGGGWWRDEENFGPNCPLREKPEPVEGGVVYPCGVETVFFGPLDSEKEIVIPEDCLLRSDDLLSCPFCGGEAKLWFTTLPDSIPKKYIECTMCGIRTKDYPGTKADAHLVEYWNGRKEGRVDVDSLAECEYNRLTFRTGEW